MRARKRDKTLIKLLVVLMLFFVAAQGGVLMFKSEPLGMSLNCTAAQSMQVDSNQTASCPDIQCQVACSISCATPYTGAIAHPSESSLDLVSPQNSCYTPFLGRMAVAPDPFPPKIANLS